MLVEHMKKKMKNRFFLVAFTHLSIFMGVAWALVKCIEAIKQ